MAKSVVGVDIGYDSFKLALVSGKQVRKTAVIPMPQQMLKEGRVVSAEAMGELIRDAMRDNGIRAAEAAIALANETVFIRNISMPVMTADQLTYNLPFEFKDYITDESKDYVFDYAMISKPEDLNAKNDEGEQNGKEQGVMELMAVAASIEMLEETKTFLHKAGMKLVKAAPALCAYQSLIRRLESAGAGFGEYCILDMGYQSIRMYMFRGDQHIVTRVLEVGMSTLDNVIAEHYNVDVHLAHTYLTSNYENCLEQDYCQNAYNNITVELMRALNFYRFSNPDSSLNDVWFCGGGAANHALQATAAETLDMRIHPAAELMPGLDVGENAYSLIQAVGVCFD